MSSPSVRMYVPLLHFATNLMLGCAASTDASVRFNSYI